MGNPYGPFTSSDHSMRFCGCVEHLSGSNVLEISYFDSNNHQSQLSPPNAGRGGKYLSTEKSPCIEDH